RTEDGEREGCDEREQAPRRQHAADVAVRSEHTRLHHAPIVPHARTMQVALKARAEGVHGPTSCDRYPRCMQDANHLVWIDLEMTGLEPANNVILEVAALITDRDLNVLGEGLDFAVHRNEDVLAAMEEWSRRTHIASGLVERVRASTVSIEEAERRTLEFIREWRADGRR